MAEPSPVEEVSAPRPWDEQIHGNGHLVEKAGTFQAWRRLLSMDFQRSCPKDHVRTSILHSGSMAQDKGDFRIHGFL